MARKPTARRSQRRLGTQYASSAPRIGFSLAPVAGGCLGRGSRLIAALLLAALGWMAYAIFTSPSFYVYGVEVQGNSVVTPEEVYAATGLEGMSVFWVNPDAIARSIEELPNVKAAQVTVRLPAQVIVAVEERSPALVWQTGEARWWIDAEGTVVPLRAEIPNALSIVDMDAQPVAPGQTLDPSILEATQALRQLLPELTKLNYSKATGISFKTREGWPVYLGDGYQMMAKLTILVTLRKDLLARGVAPEFIDVRYVEKPFYK